jgi:soluble lytic murein transglycosylase
VTETRTFVAHALVYSWIYAARMHLPAPSLDDLAAGEFPRFTPLEQERRMKVLQPALH